VIIHIRPTARAVQRAAEQVSCFGLTGGMSRQSCFQLRVVISEVLNNIVAHACCDNDGQLIQIQCYIDDHQITITSIDRGKPFYTPLSDGFPTPLTEGGRGWPIIMKWTDSFKYQSNATGNYLTLSKNIS